MNIFEIEGGRREGGHCYHVELEGVHCRVPQGIQCGIGLCLAGKFNPPVRAIIDDLKN